MKKLVYQKFSSKSMLNHILWIGLNLLKISLYLFFTGIIIYFNIFLSAVYPSETMMYPLTLVCLVISIVIGLLLTIKALKLFFSLMNMQQPMLTFTDEMLIVCFITQAHKVSASIKYTNINYVNIAKLPQEISVNYHDASENKTDTIIIPLDICRETPQDILSYFPADIPVIEKED